MGWKQKRPFVLMRMGKTPGMCLRNVRIAFDPEIPPLYFDAKAAMLANKKAGTLHDISTLPKNVAVPVFVDTASVNEHVEVSDKGTFYSDGKFVSNPMSQKFFGWGETLNDVRIVEYVADPVPPTPTPTPSGFKVGDKVTLTKWVSYTGAALKKTRDYYFISQISGDRAVLTADSVSGTVYAAVNTRNLVKYASAPVKPIGVGDKVTLKNWVDYTGKSLKKTRNYYFVSQLSGDRAVLRADSMSGAVYAAVNVSNLKRV